MGQEKQFLKASVQVRIVASHLARMPGMSAASRVLDYFDQLLSALDEDAVTITLDQLETGFEGSYLYLKYIHCGLKTTQIKKGLSDLVKQGVLKKTRTRRPNCAFYKPSTFSLDRQRIGEIADEIQGRNPTRRYESPSVEYRLGAESDSASVPGRKVTRIYRNEKEESTTSKQTGGESKSAEALLRNLGVSDADAKRHAQTDPLLIRQLEESAIQKRSKRLGSYVLASLNKGARLQPSATGPRIQNPEPIFASMEKRLDQRTRDCLSEILEWHKAIAQSPDYEDRIDNAMRAKSKLRSQIGISRSLKDLEEVSQNPAYLAALLVQSEKDPKAELIKKHGSEIFDRAVRRFSELSATQLQSSMSSKELDITS